MPVAIETGVGRTWNANQSALGTQAVTTATSTISLRQASEDVLKSNKTHGREAYVDGTAYDSSTPYLDAVAGDVGQMVFQSQIETGAAVIARHVGVDVVTGGADPYTHTISTGIVAPTYQTIRQKTGVVVGPFRAVWWDAIHGKVTMECSQGQKPKHITTEVMALKAMEIGSLTDPVAADSGTDPWRWGECVGAVQIGGTAFTETEGEMLSMDRGWDVHRGDNLEPACFIPGRGKIMRTFTTLVTDTMLPLFLNALFGSSTPTVGNRPTTQPTFAAMVTTYTRNANRNIIYNTPKVEVDPGDFILGPKPAGGKNPITYGGQALATTGVPALTVTAKTGDSVSYIA